MKNNKGFSLVELIIVIAIMAILVGVMAPQLIKYIEKTNVSADTQLADSVRTALTTACMDPAVIKTDSATVTAVTGASSWTSIGTLITTYTDGTVGGAVTDILGFQPTSANLKGKMKSSPAKSTGDVEIKADGNNICVAITNSDITGKKQTGVSANYIVVGTDTY